MFDNLIIGAEFSGSVLAKRIASQLHKQVWIIDREKLFCSQLADYNLYPNHQIVARTFMLFKQKINAGE